ncbi:MAG: hypothetical protein ACI9JM_001622 [Halioglobus sp.]|jgi:hypothetical protein
MSAQKHRSIIFVALVLAASHSSLSLDQSRPFELAAMSLSELF